MKTHYILLPFIVFSLLAILVDTTQAQGLEPSQQTITNQNTLKQQFLEEADATEEMAFAPLAAPPGPFIAWSDVSQSSIYGATSPAGTNGTIVMDGSTNATMAAGLDNDGTYFYWIDFNTSTIYRSDLDGINITPLLDTTTVSGVDTSIGLTTDGTYLYWLGTSALFRSNLDGSSPTQLLTYASLPLATGTGFSPAIITTDGTYLYWTDSNADAIYRANIDGTNPTLLVDIRPTFGLSDSFPVGITTNGSFVYWTDANSGTIYRVEKSGSNPTDLLTELAIAGITTDGTYLYYSRSASIGRVDLDGTNFTVFVDVATIPNHPYPSNGHYVYDLTFVPSPPYLTDDETQTIQNQSVTISPLTNDYSPDGPYTLTGVSNPPNGTAVLSGTTQIVYTPDTNYAGLDSFTYTATDGSFSGSATIGVQVIGPPTTQPDSATVAEGAVITLSPLDNDTDPNNLTLSIASVSNPPNGTATLSGTTHINYYSDIPFTGTDSFTYEVGNGYFTVTENINITVTPFGSHVVFGNPAQHALYSYETSLPIGQPAVLLMDGALQGLGLPEPVDIAANDTYIYWLNSVNHTLYRTHRNGSPSELLFTPATNSVHSLTEYNGTVYFTANDGTFPGIYRYTSSGSAAYVLNSTGAYAPRAITTDGTYLYWSDNNDGSIYRFDINSFTNTPFILSSTMPTATAGITTFAPVDLTTNGRYLYWTDADQEAIYRANMDGSNPTVLLTSSGPTQLTLDNNYLYWIYAEKLIGRANLDGTGAIIWLGNGQPPQSSSGPPGFDLFDGIAIVNQNLAPVAKPDTANTYGGTAVTFNLLTNDSDLNADTLTLQAVGSPPDGTLTFNSNGQVTYTPTILYAGSFTLTYTISDGEDTDTSNVIIDVARATCFATFDDGAQMFGGVINAIQNAVTAAPDGATVKVAGFCPGNNLSINKPLTIQGGYTRTNWLASPDPITYPTILDGQNAGRILENSAQTTLHHLTLQNGFDGGDGGAIYNTGNLTASYITVMGSSANRGGGIANTGGLTVSHSTVMSNTAVNGAGIANLEASVLVISSTIQSNTASQSGGGLYNFTTASGGGGGGGSDRVPEQINQTPATMVVQNSLLQNNRANSGTAIENSNSWLEMTNSTVQANQVTGLIYFAAIDTDGTAVMQQTDIISNTGTALSNSGILTGTQVLIQGNTGGVSNNDTLTLNNSQIRHHTGGTIGGLNHLAGQFTLDNVLVEHNRSSFGGGGVNVTDGNTTILNSTIQHNSGPDSGGIYYTAGQNTILNSTIAYNRVITGGNTAGIYFVTLNGTASSLTIEHSTISHNDGFSTINSAGGLLVIASNGDLTADIRHTTIVSNANTNLVYGVGSSQSFTLNAYNNLLGGQTPNCSIFIVNGGLTVNAGYNATSDASCNFSDPTNAVGTVNLQPLADNGGTTWTHLPASGNIGLNLIPAGMSGCGTTYTVDQRGQGRPFDNRCDAGAVELPQEFPVNANNDSYNINGFAPFTVAAPGVLANDSDGDNDPFTTTLLTTPAGDGFSFANDGSFTYTPTVDFLGTVTFTYSISDGLSTDTANATITVEPPIYTLNLNPSRDTTIYDHPTEQRSNALGDGFFAGENGEGWNMRGLIGFDTSSIPVGAVVTEVELTLTDTTNSGNDSTITLTPLLADWGEGTSNANTAGFGGGGGGRGDYATVGDASWAYRVYSTTVWSTAGGDFSPQVSASAYISGENVGTIFSSPQLMADVQAWIDDPATNHGWIVRSPSGSAIRFASREYGTLSARPLLQIRYYVPPLPPIAVTDVITILQNNTATITPLANDSDANGDMLTVTSITTPTNGTATLNGVNQVIYTPTLNYLGTDTFNYLVSDGTFTSTGSIMVNVIPYNCYATPDNGATVFNSMDASAVQQAVNAAPDAFPPFNTVTDIKVAGTCAGVNNNGGLSQTLYISNTRAVILRGGYSHPNWSDPANPIAYPTILDAEGNGRVIFNEGVGATEGIILQNGSADDGAGVYNTGIFAILATNVQSNTAQNSGGGVWNSGEMYAVQATIQRNTVTGGTGGGGFYNEGSLFLQQSNVFTNTTQNAVSGGGIYNTHLLTVTNNSLIQDNESTRDGGGVYNIGKTSVTQSTLDGNSAEESGGGITTVQGSMIGDEHLFIQNSTVQNNSANLTGGGGIYNGIGTSLEMDGVNLSGNSTLFGSGAGLHSLASGTVRHSTIDRNTSNFGSGGGIVIVDGHLTLLNNTISSNFVFSFGNGGGVLVNPDLSAGTGAVVTITHNTIVSNTDSGSTGNNLAIQTGSTLASVFVSNSIIGYGAGSSCAVSGANASVTSGGYNVTTDSSCGFANTGDMVVTNLPLLEVTNSEGDTQLYQLGINNPAIDRIPAGTNSCGTTIITDQRGFARPVDGKCDSGSVELETNYGGTTAVNDTYVATTNTPLTIPASGILTNDLDGDFGPLTANLLMAPASGNLTLNTDGGFVYTPTMGFMGVITFTYTVSDGTFSDTGLVTIDVIPPLTTVTLNPNQDTTIYNHPTEQRSNALGSTFFAGNNGQGWTTRGLLGFDIANTLPAGAVVYDVSLTITSTTNNASITGTVTLASMETGWGEGTSNADTAGFGSGGARGDLATDGDASWNYAVYTSTFWFNPGGDFTSTVSSSVYVGGNGRYTFPSSPQMVADVQSWLDNPMGNNGWMVRNTDETIAGRALRFGSKDNSNPNLRPILQVQYYVPNTPPVAVADNYTATQDVALVITGTGVLANDTDVDMNPLSVVSNTPPTTGTLTLLPTGAFTYTPPAGYSGVVTFTYTANDGLVDSAPAVVTINVLANGVAPTISISQLNANDAELSWLANLTNCGYQVHSNGSPYFMADSGNTLSGVLADNVTGYLLANAIGTTTFYQVVALGCSGVDAPSNEVGVFTFGIVPGTP